MFQGSVAKSAFGPRSPGPGLPTLSLIPKGEVSLVGRAWGLRSQCGERLLPNCSFSEGGQGPDFAGRSES